MKKSRTLPKKAQTPGSGFPDADSLAALRGWYSGMDARQAVVHYLDDRKATGQSSRGVLGAIRRQLARCARLKHREDLAQLFEHLAEDRPKRAPAVTRAIEALRLAPTAKPAITDAVAHWLPARAAGALDRQGISTLAELTLRIPRRRRWWVDIAGLGAGGARQIEDFFAAYPQLTEKARSLIIVPERDALPWEYFPVPRELDGSRGTFRAPLATCTLSASNDYQAVQAWLMLHEAATTQRAYRKEAERLMLWAILERGKALSSLTTEDAIAYRAFLRKPAPRERWVGPARPRSSPEWRPFQAPLAPRSAAYALSVVSALYRWLIEQRYLLANPFAGLKVKGAGRRDAFDPQRVFNEHEWSLVRGVADGIEWTGTWSEPGAQRLRFILDFWYPTGLRPGELISGVLGHLSRDDHDDDWLEVVGKGSKAGRVSVPLAALTALERHLVQRGLPVTRAKWNPLTALVANLQEDGGAITGARLWAVLKRFFTDAADVLEPVNAGLAAKLRRASPHWMRHTHATHALARGADLITVRDNLRHASISTTSGYLHGDDIKRAKQMREAFPNR